ncbi:nucleotidyltransferase family protein [Butyricicoccus sp. OM04-18BH]|nr:nucleotidyltransferase family protein [Butyricicoccus sp. OM04-18BH]
MASGLARRFGSNKLLADFGGEPMLCRALAATAGIAPRLVVTRSEEVHRLCTALDVPVLLHALPHRSDTVRLGLSALLRGQPALCGCLFVPGDQPLLRRSTVDGMCAAFAASQEKERDIFRLCAPENGSPFTVGSPVLFGREYFDALLHLPEGKGGGVVLRQHTECVRLFAAGHPAELEDADTPEALQNLLTQEAALKKVLPEAGD